MKRLFSSIIVFLFFLSAQAEVLTKLRDVQDVIATTDPRQLLYGAKVDCRLSGTIAEAIPVHDGAWYIYRVENDEKEAHRAIVFGYEKPCFFCSGFGYETGDMVIVVGSINIVYSSQALPYIMTSEIILQRSHNAPNY